MVLPLCVTITLFTNFSGPSCTPIFHQERSSFVRLHGKNFLAIFSVSRWELKRTRSHESRRSTNGFPREELCVWETVLRVILKRMVRSVESGLVGSRGSTSERSPTLGEWSSRTSPHDLKQRSKALIEAFGRSLKIPTKSRKLLNASGINDSIQ